MPLEPSKSLHFDSWEGLLRWLPEATELQLTTVFVWAGDLTAPPGDARRLAQARRLAFELLVERTHGRLLRYLTRTCGCHDVHLAEDVVQQVLLKVYLRAEQFDPGRSFWGWLYRIARNEHIDALRRSKPGDFGVGGSGRSAEDGDSWLDNLASRGAGPEAAAEEQERSRLVEDAVQALPTLQRSVVQLKRDGVKGKDIAVQLKISQAYVSQLYHEAEEVLREAVGG